jgi:hypothetical protein
VLAATLQSSALSLVRELGRDSQLNADGPSARRAFHFTTKGYHFVTNKALGANQQLHENAGLAAVTCWTALSASVAKIR